MKSVTLRKAAQIQSEISKKIAEITLPVTGTISVNQMIDPVETRNELRKKFEESVTNVSELISIQYGIRNAVGRANSLSKLNDLLTEDARINAKLRFLQSIASAVKTPMATDSVLSSDYILKLNKLTATDNNVHGYYQERASTVETVLITDDYLTQIKNDILNLKREKNELMDQILVVNTGQKIDILDSDWAILELLGVV